MTTMMMMRSLALLCLVALCFGQKKRRQEIPLFEAKVHAQKTNSRVCSNLTQVLDNWKFAIMTQVKELLLNDHSVVLPEYGRIPSLSGAVGELYKQFDSLKVQLIELTNKFEGVESFTEHYQERSIPWHPQRVEYPRILRRGEQLPLPFRNQSPGPLSAEGRRQRSRILVRKIKRPQA